MRKYPTLMSSFYWHIILCVSSQYNFYFSFSCIHTTFYSFYFISCAIRTVSLLCLLLVLLFALNSFWTKTRFLLKSLLLLSIGVLQQKRRQWERKKQHRKVCGEKATNNHTDWNFECALKIYAYIHIRKTEQKER